MGLYVLFSVLLMTPIGHHTFMTGRPADDMTKQNFIAVFRPLVAFTVDPGMAAQAFCPVKGGVDTVHT